jgi:NADH:ubiquinone reductase (non-electrogenic)
VRWFCSPSGSAGVQYVQAECTDVDVQKKLITCAAADFKDRFTVEYDHLVIAVGAEPATFGIPGVKDNAFFMKEIADSIEIQNKILQNLESANTLLSVGGNIDEVNRLLHWVVVGGGPTGVELTAELTDFIQNDIARYFPRLRNKCKVTLLEATGRILGTFDNAAAKYAQKILEERGASVVVNSVVTRIGPNSIELRSPESSSGNAASSIKSMSCGVTVWAGGIAIRPLVRSLSSQLPSSVQNSRFGLIVDDHLRVKGAEELGLWAIGDCAVVQGCAPTAQAAAQQGKFLGRLFRNYLNGEQISSPQQLVFTDIQDQFDIYNKYVSNLPKFSYVNSGALAYVGGNKGIAELKSVLWTRYPAAILSNNQDGSKSTENDQKPVQVTGTSAFAIWRSLYFSKLMSARNLFQVSFDWMRSAVFGRDISTPFRFDELQRSAIEKNKNGIAATTTSATMKRDEMNKDKVSVHK